MFSIPATLALIVLLVLHPQEYFVALTRLPILNLTALFAVLGYLLDVRLGLVRVRLAPMVWLAGGFVLWCLITVAIRNPPGLKSAAMTLLVPTLAFLLIAHGIQSFRLLQSALGVILAITLLLSFVGVHQRFAPRGCFPIIDSEVLRSKWDGRFCPEGEAQISAYCSFEEGAEPGVEYNCSHIGLLGTYSIGERVRFLGKLEDPNELSLVIGIGVPIAFGFLMRRRDGWRVTLALVTLILGCLAAVYTQSRGGQLVLGTVLAVYFVRRYGWRGLVAAAVLALPVLLFGGRSNADDSSEERLECSQAGFQMFFHSPLIGVGQGLFTDHHVLTAHNSFVLAMAELGVPGLLLWTAVLYMAVKTPIAAIVRYSPRAGDAQREDAAVAVEWSMVLLAAWLGILVGIFFLSFCYKEILWIFVGFSGALFGAIRRHDPDFRVSFTLRDAATVVALNLLLLGSWGAYLRLRLGAL